MVAVGASRQRHAVQTYTPSIACRWEGVWGETALSVCIWSGGSPHSIRGIHGITCADDHPYPLHHAYDSEAEFVRTSLELGF